MKNPLTFPLILLFASLAILVSAILMTPEIEEAEDPSFDLILEATGAVRTPAARSIGRTDADASSEGGAGLENASPVVDEDPFISGRTLAEPTPATTPAP